MDGQVHPRAGYYADVTGTGGEHNQTLSYRDCCALLGVPETASRREAALAFRRRVRECHPDTHPERADAEHELMRVIRAHRLLDDYQRQRKYSRIETAFQECGKAAARRETEPAVPEDYLRRCLTGMAVGLAAGLLSALFSGGLHTLEEIPAVLWSVAGMPGPGALAGGLLAMRGSDAGAPARFAAGSIAGAALGIIAATAYVMAVGEHFAAPAYVWALSAFASLGGLTAIVAAMIRQRR